MRELSDAQKMVKVNPFLYRDVPSPELVEFVNVGYAVQLSDGIQQFWVHVTDAQGSALKGRIVTLAGGRGGEVIEFERRHVYDFEPPPSGAA